MVALRTPYHQPLVDASCWSGVVDVQVDEVSAPPIDPSHRINLTWRIHQIYVWIHRYVQVYGRAPNTSDIADGVDIPRVLVGRDLDELEDIGAVARTGDTWRPLRAP